MSSTSSRPNAPPVVRPTVNRPSTNSILVNKRQEQNPLLELLRNVAWEYAVISPDFQVGATTCALFLSLRYYRLHPEYLHRRISDLGNAYTLRVLIFHIDAKDPENEIKELTKISLVHNLTIMAAWSMEDAAQYLMTYKAYENRPLTMIKERIDQDYNSILRSALTSIKGVNKTDVITLKTNFGDFAGISRATLEELQLCPGFGKVKAKRVKDAFSRPFFPGRQNTLVSSRKGKEKAPGQGPGLPAQQEPASNSAMEIVEDPAPAQFTTAPVNARFSPDWNIELDLNPDDEVEVGNAREPSASPQPLNPKKRRKNPFAE